MITVLIVTIFLGTVSTALMGIVYMNMRNAEQADAIVRARVAAHSVLFALGSEASRDIAKGRDPLGIKDGTDMTDTFRDGDMYITINGATDEYEQVYLLTCTARHMVRKGTSPTAEEVKATVTEQLEVRKKSTTSEKGETETSARWRWKGKEGGA